MARFPLFAAGTAVLWPAISNSLAAAPANCTNASFTTPSWLVQDFVSQSSADSTVASFHVLNRAVNTSFQLRCSSSNPTAGWQSCSTRNQTNLSSRPFMAAFQADHSTAWFLLNETWSCSDAAPGKQLNFTAVGNSSVPLNCSSSTAASGVTTCRSTKPLLVKAALLSPVKITPAYVGGPTGHDVAGCTANAKTPAWEVAATQLNLRNISGSLQGGNAFVIVRNDQLGYTASCGGTLTGVAGPQALSCQGQTAYRRPDKYQIQTVVLLEPKTFALTVNQTWFCDDLDPAQPISITASGTATLPLECQIFNEGTTFCTGGSSGTFAGNVTSRALLPPYSLNDPLPTGESCTVSSVVAPAWWFSDFETSTTPGQSDAATVRFGMELQTGGGGGGVDVQQKQPTGNQAYIVANGVRYANISTNSSSELPWYDCAIESVGDPALAPTGCAFRYDVASGFLGLRVQWRCADLDAGSPVTFRGEIRTLVPEQTCVTSGTQIRCAAPNPTPWCANVTSVTWE